MSRLRSRTRAAALAAALLAAAGCEDTPVVAPTDGQIIVSANPGNVIIDTQGGETTGQSTITARVLDAKGLGVVNATVYFTAEAGALDSSDNSCVALRCRSTGDPCATTADCTPISPTARETDPDGFVSDVLTLSVADPSSSKVNVTSGKLAQSVTVTKTVTQSGNVLPIAKFTLSPADQQCADESVEFDGSESDDPDGAITCYQWRIDSSLNTRDEVVQGSAREQFTRTYGDGQSLVVTLRVSDDTTAGFCEDCEACSVDQIAEPARFSSSLATHVYAVVEDLTAPTANAGADRDATLASGSVTVVLDGSASDAEAPIVAYAWKCNKSNSSVVNTPSATCTYTSAGAVTAEFTVTNACGLTGTDEVVVTVLPGVVP